MSGSIRAPRLLLSCGEPSGDLYGAQLLRRLRARCDGLTAFGVGGDRLAEQGADLLAHIRELAVVGILEVIRHVPRIRRVLKEIVDELDRRRPDAAVLVDYPDFNLRLARELKKRGVPVLYYVSPQIWAWKRGRIRTIRECVSRMLVIFPFEEALYRSEGVPVSLVGHPLVEWVSRTEERGPFLKAHGLDPSHPVVTLLPGSREGEVRNNLPVLREAVRRVLRAREKVQFLLAAAPLIPRSSIDRELQALPITVVEDSTYDAVASADVAVVASGTATVETALLGTPMVVVYRVAPLTYAIGRPFVKVPHFAMVNLIAEREVVPELMQKDFTPEGVARETLDLLENRDRASRMRADLAEVRQRLGGPGATDRAAAIVGEALGCGGGGIVVPPVS